MRAVPNVERRPPTGTRWPEALCVLASAIGLAIAGPSAQIRPIYETGTAGLIHLLGRLQTTASVLHTGAHPDDEDSAFLARTARGDHARVAYLSLTRGEGGQNIIGPELFDALGVIRTEELLQARRLDGAEQFFTRAFDYGFSKTLAEARSKWNERAVLGDMVRVIRTFRPLVVYARFGGTPADGHGQHQFAGYLTPIAFRAAADPAQFPEQLREGLRPWQARKLYRAARGAGPENRPTLEVATGGVDPVIGRPYGAIAAEGRSQHKSQETGGIEPLGPSTTPLRLLESVVSQPPAEQSVFDGIDTSIGGIASLAGLPRGAFATELGAIDVAVARAAAEFRPLEPERLVPLLAEGLRATRQARSAIARAPVDAGARADADFLLASKEADFVEALAQAAGIVVDPLADAETVVPGGTLDVTVRLFLEHPDRVRVSTTAMTVPQGWESQQVPTAAATGGFRRETPTSATSFRVRVPAGAASTEPYFLERPRTGDLYDWPESPVRGRPFDDPLLTARVTLSVGGEELALSRPVQYRFADRVRGEIRRDIDVVPDLTVGLDSNLLVVPSGGAAQPQRLVVRASSSSRDSLSGTLRLRLPAGWTATPAEVPFTLAPGHSTTSVFVAMPSARRSPGTLSVAAEAVVGGRTFSTDVQQVAYAHIQTHRIYSQAQAMIKVFDFAVAPVRVGYIMGSGDEVPAALRRMGVDVTMIDPTMLATADLSVFDTIVVGVRASEARPDFVANHERLHRYMENGGTLVVQYQQLDYEQQGLPPFPVEEGVNSRVTDETAAVEILEPDHPVFTFPNRITQADFAGWVQERNLYAFPRFDPRYVPLLESADPGEPAQRGGEVYARVGKGQYVYTAYAWFRQLRAGVPGAYRQFANLVSLSKAGQ